MVHAGSGIGLGHLRRSLVAANALASRLGALIDFIAIGRSIDISLAELSNVNFSVTDEKLEAVLNRIRASKRYSAICLDLFQPFVNEDTLSALISLREIGCRIISIDPMPYLETQIDLVYVPSFLQPAPSDLPEFKTRIVYGWDTYLLDVQPKERRSHGSKSILVLSGGSDVSQLGRDWPTLLDNELSPSSVVHWVTGPFSRRPSFPSLSRVKFIEHVAPVGLNELMNGADLAITVFGVSFFELLALGVPTVVFCPNNNKHKRELSAISDLGISIVADNVEDATKKAALLAQDDNLKLKLSRNSTAILKRFGGERFVKEFVSICDK